MPFAGNTHDLQNRRGDVQTWFMETAAKVNPRALQKQTTQGFYVAAPDGKAYGFNNNRSVERVLEFMRRGKAAHAQDPPVRVEVPAPKSVILAPPPGSAVLRVYSRIRPVPAGAQPSNENLQRDHFWILSEELRELGDAASGTGEVPASLAARLSRFALVDAIRGEPDFWRHNEVRTSAFHVARRSDGKLELKGRYAMRTADGARGLEGTFEAELKVAGSRLAEFRGYAEATAWGQGTYTPGAPSGKFPVKFAFVLAPSTADTVAPQAAMYGREYLGR